MFKYGFVSELASPSLLEIVLVGDGVACGARTNCSLWGPWARWIPCTVILLGFMWGLGTGLSSPPPPATHPRPTAAPEVKQPP